MSRILRSSANSLPNSFFSAYHLDRQSLLTATRSPIGLVFCPIANSEQPYRLSRFETFPGSPRPFVVGGGLFACPASCGVRQNDLDMAVPLHDRTRRAPRLRRHTPHWGRGLSLRFLDAQPFRLQSFVF